MTLLDEEQALALLEGGASGPNLHPVAEVLFQAEDGELRALARVLADVISRANWFDVGGFGRSLLVAEAARILLRPPAVSVKEIREHLELMNPVATCDQPNTNPNGYQIELVLTALKELEK